MGRYTIYATLHLTSSSGLAGLLPEDYPKRNLRPGDYPPESTDELPLLTLLDKVGGFALLLAMHHRGITSPYSTLRLDETPNSDSRKAETILAHIAKHRPKNFFALPSQTSSSARSNFKNFFGNERLGEDFSMGEDSHLAKYNHALQDDNFLNALLPVCKRSKATFRKLWSNKVGQFRKKVGQNLEGSYSNPGSYFMFLFERSTDCLTTHASVRRLRRLELTEESVTFQHAVLLGVLGLGFSTAQLGGLDVGSVLAPLLLRSSTVSDAVAAFQRHCAKHSIVADSPVPVPPAAPAPVIFGPAPAPREAAAAGPSDVDVFRSGAVDGDASLMKKNRLRRLLKKPIAEHNVGVALFRDCDLTAKRFTDMQELMITTHTHQGSTTVRPEFKLCTNAVKEWFKRVTINADKCTPSDISKISGGTTCTFDIGASSKTSYLKVMARVVWYLCQQSVGEKLKLGDNDDENSVAINVALADAFFNAAGSAKALELVRHLILVEADDKDNDEEVSFDLLGAPAEQHVASALLHVNRLWVCDATISLRGMGLTRESACYATLRYWQRKVLDGDMCNNPGTHLLSWLHCASRSHAGAPGGAAFVDFDPVELGKGMLKATTCGLIITSADINEPAAFLLEEVNSSFEDSMKFVNSKDLVQAFTGQLPFDYFDQQNAPGSAATITLIKTTSSGNRKYVSTSEIKRGIRKAFSTLSLEDTLTCWTRYCKAESLLNSYVTMTVACRTPEWNVATYTTTSNRARDIKYFGNDNDESLNCFMHKFSGKWKAGDGTAWLPAIVAQRILCLTSIRPDMVSGYESRIRQLKPANPDFRVHPDCSCLIFANNGNGWPESDAAKVSNAAFTRDLVRAQKGVSARRVAEYQAEVDRLVADNATNADIAKVTLRGCPQYTQEHLRTIYTKLASLAVEQVHAENGGNNLILLEELAQKRTLIHTLATAHSNYGRSGEFTTSTTGGLKHEDFTIAKVVGKFSNRVTGVREEDKVI